MISLIVGLLFVVVVMLLVLITMIGVNIYLTHKTLVRPEAPCYASAPRFGMTAIDSDHPQYNSLLAKLKGGNKAVATDEKKPTVGDGNYL